MDSLALAPALAFASVFLLVYAVQQGLDRRARNLSQHLSRFTYEGRVIAGEAATHDLLRRRRRFSTIATLDRFLNRQSFAARMDLALAAAGLPLRVGEYLFLRWACALTLAALASNSLDSALLAAPAGVAGYFLPSAYVGFRTRQRADLFNQQLVDGLALIAGGLRAGYSFLQGIEAVVRELPDPIRGEFRTVLEDLRLGVPAEEALLGLARRVPTEDVDMMVTAMLVQRTSGGNLSEVLDNIARTIRERIRIRREVNTLTAQERMSSYVVGGLPIVAFATLMMVNQEYLDLLFTSTLGHVLLVTAATLEVIGFYVIRRIVDIRL